MGRREREEGKREEKREEERERRREGEGQRHTTHKKVSMNHEVSNARLDKKCFLLTPGSSETGF